MSSLNDEMARQTNESNRERYEDRLKEQIAALTATITTLRALVQEAYEEGRADAEGGNDFYCWAVSDAREALLCTLGGTNA